ncbi:MAG: hypothetical protein H5T91_08745, partial [Synergistetes bacterium]|nr:hypothetical protein [Synergistota bacterium]
MDLNREEAQKLLELLKNERLSQEEREVFLRNLKESFPDLWEEYVLWKALSRSEEVSFHWKESLDLKRKRSYTLLIVSL